LSAGDLSKVSAWLEAYGLKINDVAQGRHWITSSGPAARVEAAFRTEIHRYAIDGETLFANSTPLSIPAALDGIVGAVGGLNNFGMRHTPRPAYTGSGGVHYLAPDDLATIYDITPLYQVGYDGAGQKIMIIGGSDIEMSDLQGFATTVGLPFNPPQMVLVGPDPGFNDDQGEGEGDLESVVSVARNATVLYVYAKNLANAIQYAIDQDLAPVLSTSYAACEADATPADGLMTQQASVQGITWIAAAGDSGPAACDAWFDPSVTEATHGLSVDFPASSPEVTGVGGTEFNDGAGNYWSFSNSPTGESALSYIPEIAWNDTGSEGLEAGGGGASVLFPKPIWQSGPGVPNDGARDVPDVSMAASAVHDSYLLYYEGATDPYGGGTSAASPVFAGIIVLLNQYLAAHGMEPRPGLGNVNPALYRMAQNTTDVFHDITVGNTMVPCQIGTPDCTTGYFGFKAGPGYDQATGLGSVDAYDLVTEWSSKSRLPRPPAPLPPRTPAES
jgi:subtilase family serine protease